MEGGTNVPKMGQGVLGDGGASFDFFLFPKISLLAVADHLYIRDEKGEGWRKQALSKIL